MVYDYQELFKTKECLICNFSSSDFKKIKEFRNELLELGYFCNLVSSKSLNGDVPVLSGSVLLLFSINNDFFINYQSLNDLLIKKRNIFVVGFFSNKKIYLTSFLKNIHYDKTIILKFLYKRIILYYLIITFQIKLVGKVLYKKIDGNN